MSYWRVYIVMVKAEGDKLFRPHQTSMGCAVAHESLEAAKNALRSTRMDYPNAYIQKCGAIS